MKRTFLLICLLSIIALSPIFSQQANVSVYSRIGGAWLQEWNLGIRTSVSPMVSLDLNAGYLARYSPEIPKSGFAFENIGQEDIWKYSGLVVRPGITIQKPKARFYQTINLMLRYSWIPEKEAHIGIYNSSEVHYKKFSRSTYNIGAEWLANFELIPSDRAVRLDFYLGYGLKVLIQKDHVSEESVYYYSQYSLPVDYNRSRIIPVVPSFLVGFNVGMNFGK